MTKSNQILKEKKMMQSTAHTSSGIMWSEYSTKIITF